MAKKLVLDTIFKTVNNVAKKSIKAVEPVAGHKVEYFYPVIDPTPDIPQVFNNDTQSFEYRLVPDKTKASIVLGLFGDGFDDSDASFDNYGQGDQDPFILTDKDNLIPKNTKVKIYRGKDNYFLMKIVTHKVYPSVKGRIYYKNMLASFNS